MSKKIKIPNQFWKQNPLEAMSSAQISYFSMRIFPADEINEAMLEIASPHIPLERQTEINAELQEIASLDSGAAVVKFMRHEYDIVNRNTLCKKALEMQEDVMPLVLRRFQTSVQTVFIETAAMIFSHCDTVYAVKLREIYPDIRDPYARSIASLALAVQGDEEAVPLLLWEYERLRREYPDENYDQGPLLALYSLYKKI